MEGQSLNFYLSFVMKHTTGRTDVIFIPLIWEASRILSCREDLSVSDSHQWTARQKDKKGRIWKSFSSISSETLTALREMRLGMEWNKFAFQSTFAAPPTMLSLHFSAKYAQKHQHDTSQGELNRQKSERGEKISHLSANHNIPLVLSHRANKSKYN